MPLYNTFTPSLAPDSPFQRQLIQNTPATAAIGKTNK